MSLDWYPLYPIDWKRDTLHLTLAEDGAYRRLNDEYMNNAGPLPDNDVALARLIGVTLETWREVAPAVRKFYQASNGRLIHKRCEKELHAQYMQVQYASMHGKKAANARWEKFRNSKRLIQNGKDAGALHEQSSSNAPVMPNDATLRKKDTTTSFGAAREEVPSFGPARDLASAPPAGALARSPATEPRAKRPADVSKKELDEIFARKP